MSSSGAVAVRIPRGPKSGAGVEPTPVSAPLDLPEEGVVAGRGEEEGGKGVAEASGTSRLENRAGLQRSTRLFVVGFLLLPILIFGTFAAVILSSSYAAIREGGGPFLGYLGAILAVIVVLGFFQTLWRTPRAFQKTSQVRLQVFPFLGSPFSVPLSSRSFAVLLEFYAPGPLAPKGVELVEVFSPPGRSRRWILEEELLQEMLPRRSGGPGKRGKGTKVEVPTGAGDPQVEPEGSDGPPKGL